MRNLYYSLIGLNSDFDRIFFTNEYRALAGKKGRTILSLLGILFVTFIAIGFAVGSIENLKTKMDNPFTNWVELKVTDYRISNKATKLIEEYNRPDVMEKYQLDRSNGFCEFVLHIYKADFRVSIPLKDTLNRTVWGRSIESDEALLQKILEGENIVWRAPNFDPLNDPLESDEIVVTEELIRQLGYEKVDSNFGSLLVYIEPNPVCLKVRAVVTNLPGVSTFVSSPALYNTVTAKIDTRCTCGELVHFNDANSSELSFLLKTEGNHSSHFDSICLERFSNRNVDIDDAEAIQIGGRGYIVKKMYFFPSDKPDSISIESFQKTIGSMFETCPFAYLETDAQCCRAINYSDYHNLAFNFRRLDDIREFGAELVDRFGIEIDMNQVEEKENFAIVSKLTFFISLVLLFLGISSIVLFVTNLLKSHLGSIRSNLGTLQAFGLSNQLIKRIYLKIIATFLIQSVISASMLSLAIEVAEGYLMGKNSLFSFINQWVVVSIAGLITFGMWFSSAVINKLMNDTPGNMIYER